ncbi:unnamed protein product, partial [Meganyctiphanes norvegica]
MHQYCDQRGGCNFSGLLLKVLFMTLYSMAPRSPAPLLSETRYGVERPGEECLMGSGHVGQCMEIYQCLDKRATLLSNNTLHRCQTSQDGKIYICCHDYVQLAADCNSWQNDRFMAAVPGLSEARFVVANPSSDCYPGDLRHMVYEIIWLCWQGLNLDY